MSAAGVTVTWPEVDGVATCHLLLDRPERANALDAAAVEALHEALDRAEDAGVDLVVLRGRGSAFCGGLDLSGLADETDATLLLRLVRIQLLLERLQAFPALTVALVEAPAVGAGADLVLATDVRLALPSGSLRFPGSGFGAVLGVARLAAETGPSYATETALSARVVSADEAERRGLWRVLDPRADLDAELARLARAAGRVPGDTGQRLRRAAAGSPASDALGDLVRSLAATPGLQRRILDYAAPRGARPTHPTPLRGAAR